MKHFEKKIEGAERRANTMPTKSTYHTQTLNYRIAPGDPKNCKGCKTNLDYHSKVLERCDNFTWQVVACLRCGSITLYGCIGCF